MNDKAITIKNFHCSEHGEVKPNVKPECPKCHTEKKEGLAWVRTLAESSNPRDIDLLVIRVEVELETARKERDEELVYIKSVLKDTISRTEDIIKDIEVIPGNEKDGRLGGIMSVAGAIRDSLNGLERKLSDLLNEQ